jgi:tRNA pseudouridine38-40 synthase
LPRFRLILAYDGTDFAGWQVQRKGGRTVQGTLEESLVRLAGGRPVRVAAAGRTDAGVHALGQVASFDLERDMKPDALQSALNGLLPADLRVRDASRVADDFHARRSAVSKVYRYVLDCGEVLLPQRRRWVGWVPRRLDAAAVRQVAALFPGRHDFSALASSGGSVKTTVRNVSRSEVTFDEGGFVYEVEADGFLRKMVRSMVGGLIAAGEGARTAGDLALALESRDRRNWPAPAPARGLTLVRVDYRPPDDAVLP